ncbi:MAG: DNA-processing protein DprA [Desulfobacterota bacterium]|nr:DNA-processing protein DprA [Thermodesulfobacteriota bacterium]
MAEDPRYAWLTLSRIPGIGPVLYRRLLEKFQSPDQVFKAGLPDLLSVSGLGEKAARAIVRSKRNESVEREIEALDRLGVRLVTILSPDYPPLLARIYDPPPFLYCLGSGSLRDRPVIAMVGSRNASAYGRKITERLAYSLALAGVVVVSGLARGIDTAAHNGALIAKGRTVAVLGSGLDVVYPPENRNLVEQITEKGLVCSEFPLGALPERPHFPVRNRIISGLSLGVVIVEATQHSGSLITARLALEQGREVFAVPGSVESFKSSGTHGLIKQGAKLVERAQDILEEIPGYAAQTNPESETPVPAPALGLSADQLRIWGLLADGPKQIDPLVRETGLAVGLLLSHLLDLELKGVIKQLPGKFFERK